jgi:hypothetical protein
LGSLRRFGCRNARQECDVVIKLRPGTFIDIEVTESQLAKRRSVGLEFLMQRLIAGPNLSYVERIKKPRRGDDLVESLAVVWRQSRNICGDLGWCKSGDLADKPRNKKQIDKKIFLITPFLK